MVPSAITRGSVDRGAPEGWLHPTIEISAATIKYRATVVWACVIFLSGGVGFSGITLDITGDGRLISQSINAACRPPSVLQATTQVAPLFETVRDG